jgi:hypothetical protein
VRPGNLSIFVLFVLVILFGAVVSRAQTTPRYYDQQLLNYRFTEFCAQVKPLPPGLVESINNAFEKDATIRPIWEWIHSIRQRRAEHCGDA